MDGEAILVRRKPVRLWN